MVEKSGEQQDFWTINSTMKVLKSVGAISFFFLNRKSCIGESFSLIPGSQVDDTTLKFDGLYMRILSSYASEALSNFGN